MSSLETKYTHYLPPEPADHCPNKCLSIKSHYDVAIMVSFSKLSGNISKSSSEILEKWEKGTIWTLINNQMTSLRFLSTNSYRGAKLQATYQKPIETDNEPSNNPEKQLFNKTFSERM